MAYIEVVQPQSRLKTTQAKEEIHKAWEDFASKSGGDWLALHVLHYGAAKNQDEENETTERLTVGGTCTCLVPTTILHAAYVHCVAVDVRKKAREKREQELRQKIRLRARMSTNDPSATAKQQQQRALELEAQQRALEQATVRAAALIGFPSSGD